MLPPAAFARMLDGSGWQVRRVIDDGSPRYAVVLEKAAARGRAPRVRASPPSTGRIRS
jgi:hypothetical protein